MREGMSIVKVEPCPGKLSTVILPPSPADGQVYELATRQTIDALSVLPASSETVDGGGPFMLTANGGASWLYSVDDNTWSRRY